MKIVLFRHAEKNSEAAANPPLSSRGVEQARHLCEEVLAGKIPSPQALFTSPRLRTQQTFQILAQKKKLAATPTPLLDQRGAQESSLDFRRRVQEFLVSFQMDFQDNDCVFLCSHIDWIEEFLSIIECNQDLSKFSSWPSGAWLALEKSDGAEIWRVLQQGQV